MCGGDIAIQACSENPHVFVDDVLIFSLDVVRTVFESKEVARRLLAARGGFAGLVLRHRLADTGPVYTSRTKFPVTSPEVRRTSKSSACRHVPGLSKASPRLIAAASIPRRLTACNPSYSGG